MIVPEERIRLGRSPILDGPDLTDYPMAGIIFVNKTRQGYARKRNLKLAGYFFYGPGRDETF